MGRPDGPPKKMPSAIVPLLAAGIASVTGFSPFVSGLIASLAVTAVVTGFQMLLASDNEQKLPKAPDGKAPRQQAVPPVSFGYGVVRTAGAYMLWESAGDNLYSVQALFAHPCHGVQNIYLNDDLVTIGAGDFVNEGADGRYRSQNIWLQVRLGATPETAYSRHVAALTASGLWTSSHRGDGQTSIGIECHTAAQNRFRETYPHGAPSASVVLHTQRVFDSRDLAQDVNDPSTYVFSRNPVLCLMHWLCFSYFGPKWPYASTILPVIETWEEAAGYCDELVEKEGGGTEPRYQVDGWATSETDPVIILNQFLASCDGHLAQYGDGALVITVGKFLPDRVVDIYDYDIVGHYIQSDVPEEEEINRLVPKFINPATAYTTDTTDYYEDTAAQIKAGRVLSEDAEYTWVTSWTQARRLAKREWDRIQQKKSGTFDLRLSGINAVRARWVRVNSFYRIPSLNGAIVENRRSIMALSQGGFQMEWRLHSASDGIDEWNPEEDEGAPPPTPSEPDPIEIEVPEIDGIETVGTGTVYLLVTIEEPAASNVYIPVVRYRVKSPAGPWVEQRFPDYTVSGGLIDLATNPVPVNTELEVEVAFIASQGTYSDWSDTEDVVTNADSIAPSALASFSVAAGAHLGAATLQFTTSADPHQSRVVVYRVPNGVTLDKNTHTKITIGAGPSLSGSYVDGDGTRTNLLSNGDFAGAGPPPTLQANWSISAGKASKTSGAQNSVFWSSLTITAGDVLRMKVTIDSISGSTLLPRNTGTVTESWATSYTTSGTKLQSLTCAQNNTQFGFLGATTTVCQIDDVVLFKQTGTCIPQGLWDYYAFPANASGIEGTGATPVTGVTII